jgi:hypothetical protein
MGDPGELRAMTAAIGDKIRRIRGAMPLSPSGALPVGERVPPARDPWMRPLAFGALGAAAIALLLFMAFRLSLGSAVATLRAVVPQLPS